MNIIIIVIIVIILIFLLANKKETFRELSYTDNYDEIECCKQHGCQSPNCIYYLHNKNIPTILLGTLINNQKNILSLYQQYNEQTNGYDYFYKKNDKYIKIKTDGSELMTNDKVKINGSEYKVYIHNINLQIMNNNKYYSYFQPFRRYINFEPIESNKIIKPIMGTSGILIDNDKKYLVIELILNPQRHEYRYMVKINDNLIDLDIDKKLQDGSIVNIPGLNIDMKYLERQKLRYVY